VYESRSRSVIIILGRQLYRIPEVAPPTAISLIFLSNAVRSFHRLRSLYSS
jgi:hypothetical protein